MSEYTIYNDKDKQVAVIQHSGDKYSIQDGYTISELPLRLQATLEEYMNNQEEIDLSKRLQNFIEHRIPRLDRESINNTIVSRGYSKSMDSMLGYADGRVLTDNFYILVNDKHRSITYIEPEVTIDDMEENWQ